MKKQDYLIKTRPFIEWMSDNLYETTFEHSYIDRRHRKSISFNSIYDAYEKYRWIHPAIERLNASKGHTFETNFQALTALQDELIKSIKEENNEHTCRAAIDVMRWGGVSNGNVIWLNANRSELVNILRRVRDALNTGETQNNALTETNLRFNAGMTKVYSLLADDFIIYDSRVAAALGLAVTKYVNSGNEMIDELYFPCSPAKESQNARRPKNRNPSRIGDLKFPKLNSGPKHVEWNLKASWILKAVVDLDKTKAGNFSQVSQTKNLGLSLRALEAALFMIGYDLPFTNETATIDLPDGSHSPTSDIYPSPWIECMTLKRNRPFDYRLTDKGFEVKEGQLFTTDIVNKTLTILRRNLANNPFPLQNNAVEVTECRAPMGLGTAYKEACGGNPPNTSRLAAILEDLRIILRAEMPNTEGMHWHVNPDLIQNSPENEIHALDIKEFVKENRELESEA